MEILSAGRWHRKPDVWGKSSRGAIQKGRAQDKTYRDRQQAAEWPERRKTVDSISRGKHWKGERNWALGRSYYNVNGDKTSAVATWRRWGPKKEASAKQWASWKARPWDTNHDSWRKMEGKGGSSQIEGTTARLMGTGRKDAGMKPDIREDGAVKWGLGWMRQ